MPKLLSENSHAPFWQLVPGVLALRYRRFRIHRHILSLGFTSAQLPHEGLHVHVYRNYRQQAPTLVLLHGFLDSSHTWRRLLPDLSERYNLVLIDIPGFGYSRMPAIRMLWNIPSMAASLARFIFSTLELNPVRLLTHSLGGLLAVHIFRYAQQQLPEANIEAMHLIAPGLLRMPPAERDKIRRQLFPRSIAEVRELIQQIYTRERADLSDWILRGLLYEWSHTGYLYLAENTVENESNIFLQPADLKPYQKFTTLYWNRADGITPYDMGRRIKRACPKIQLITLEAGGHAPQQEAPMLLLNKLHEHLL